MILRTILSQLWHDRAVQAGTGSSVTSLGGAAWIDNGHWSQPEFWTSLQPYLAAFAAFFGGLSALATCIYVTIKIVRLLRNPDAKS